MPLIFLYLVRSVVEISCFIIFTPWKLFDGRGSRPALARSRQEHFLRIGYDGEYYITRLRALCSIPLIIVCLFLYYYIYLLFIIYLLYIFSRIITPLTFTFICKLLSKKIYKFGAWILFFWKFVFLIKFQYNIYRIKDNYIIIYSSIIV